MRGGAEVARRAHNPKVVGSNPAPATKRPDGIILQALFFIPDQLFMPLLVFLKTRNMNNLNIPSSNLPRIIIVGGGFAGIELIKKLNTKKYQIVLIDRQNYHTFQPLLYQVASGGLESNSIAYPLRKFVKRFGEVFFRYTNVRKVDVAQKAISTDEGALTYDFLLIATGSKTNYFGNKNIEQNSMPLKTLSQSLDLRSMILQNIEQAVFTSDKKEREALLTFVVAGGGPTGVELAGALCDLKRYVFRNEYHDLNMNDMQIILVEGSQRLLAGMSEKASAKTLDFLRKMGADVRLKSLIQDYDGTKVLLLDGGEILSHNLIWAAGVKADVPQGLEPAVETRSGRLMVDQFSQINLAGKNHNIFVLGDAALMKTEDYPHGHPMVAPVAIQQADLWVANLKRMGKKQELKAFQYRDKGSMATIGRSKAVVDLPWFGFQGWFAWITWLFVHLMSIIGFENRLFVLLNWFMNYLKFNSALRLIIRPFDKK